MKKVKIIILALSLYGVLTGCTDSNSGNSIIDDPEINDMFFGLSDPSAWTLASVPADPLLFPESSLINNAEYNNNRALLSWYTVDRLFSQGNSAYAPDYIKNDMDALSYPYAREVANTEVFPLKEINYDGASVIYTLNLSFYPRERGPYNLDAKNIDQDGNLLYPERRWGGIMRKIDDTNFEQADINCIEFWLLDPFMDPELDNRDGGYLYFNLGDVSEDVLKDGLLSYENGLPIDGDDTYVTYTAWGKVSNLIPSSYAFDYRGAILQDVGLDGLSNQEEAHHPAYAHFVNKLREVLSESAIIAMYNDPFSPFNDPAGDDYAYYRHAYYDIQRFPINSRYKHYNGTDGNSFSKNDASDAQYRQARSTPDAEDINHSFTLDNNERFFQYRIVLHPDSMQVGRNYITDLRVANVHTRNGGIQQARWYEFTIPLAEYERTVGSIHDFSDIRFIRMFMTGFRGITHLRFATLELR